MHCFFKWRTNHKYHVDEVKIKRIRDTIIQWDSTDIGFLWFDSTNTCGKTRHKQLDSILTPINKQFILQQINQSKTINAWNKKSFPGQKIVKNKPLNKIRRRTGYWEFSVPLFTTDKKYCFIKETYVCGLMCIDWSALLYQKMEDGQWKLITTIWSISS
jgi:hypothetical protein